MDIQLYAASLPLIFTAYVAGLTLLAHAVTRLSAARIRARVRDDADRG